MRKTHASNFLLTSVFLPTSDVVGNEKVGNLPALAAQARGRRSLINRITKADDHIHLMVNFIVIVYLKNPSFYFFFFKESKKKDQMIKNYMLSKMR